MELEKLTKQLKSKAGPAITVPSASRTNGTVP